MYRKRGMPDYAAYAFRAHMAAGGAGMAYLAWAGLGRWDVVKDLPSGVAWIVPVLPVPSMAIGAAGAVAFGLLTKRGDWRYREVRVRAAHRLRAAQRFRALGPDHYSVPTGLAELAPRVADVRAELGRADPNQEGGSGQSGAGARQAARRPGHRSR